MKKTASKSQIRSFSVVYEADPEGGYIAFIPSLPGCHTQGDTLEEAEHNIKEAAALYLENSTVEQRFLIVP
jgi:predicted RNase H-like HicB family nuclease